LLELSGLYSARAVPIIQGDVLRQIDIFARIG